MEQKTIKRGEFLRELGLSSAALMAFYCLGTTMTACSTGEDPAPSTPTTPTGTTGVSGNADTAKGKIDFTLDLTATAYSKLKTQGSFVVEGSVIVANAKGKFVALSKACTHQGTTVEYRSAQDDFFCSNHGSAFANSGAVKTGPATRALTVYTTTVSTDGNKLTIKE